jgi:hypothetical protein
VLSQATAGGSWHLRCALSRRDWAQRVKGKHRRVLHLPTCGMEAGEATRHGEEVAVVPQTQRARRLILVALLGLVLGHPPAARAQQVVVQAQHGKVGETLTFTVSLEQALKAVGAWGFTLLYNPEVLHYTGTFTPGGLVRGFEFFGVHERQPGRIRVGGFTTKTAIAQGARGELAALSFTVVGRGNTEMQIVQLVNDLAGLTVVPGTFTGEMTARQDLPSAIMPGSQTGQPQPR